MISVEEIDKQHVIHELGQKEKSAKNFWNIKINQSLCLKKKQEFVVEMYLKPQN